MQTTRLSEIPNGHLQFAGKDGQPYSIKFDRTDLLILKFGFDAHKSSYHKFISHENLLAAIPSVHGYKHYRKDGGKSWTYRAGVDLYFAVPASAIEVCHFEGYSYVKVLINGQEIVLNVSGGTFNGWTDSVGRYASTSTNMKPAILKALLEVALPVDEVQTDVEFKMDERFSAVEWQALIIRHLVTITAGMEFVLSARNSFMGQKRRLFADYKNNKSGKEWTANYRPEGAPADVKSPVNIPLSRVDFLETARANGIEIPDPNNFLRVPVPA